MCFRSILEPRIHQRKSALDGGDEEQIEQVGSHYHHTGGNTLNNEGKIITLPMEKKKIISYQGMNANSNYFHE